MTTAEAAAVNDTTPYPSLPVVYNISNVGYAATGGADPSNPNHQLFGAPLSATIAAGNALAAPGANFLSSWVVMAGSGGSNAVARSITPTTMLTSGAVNAANYLARLAAGATSWPAPLLPAAPP